MNFEPSLNMTHEVNQFVSAIRGLQLNTKIKYFIVRCKLKKQETSFYYKEYRLPTVHYDCGM